MSVLNLQVRCFRGLAYMEIRSVRGIPEQENRVTLKVKEEKSFLVVII